MAFVYYVRDGSRDDAITSREEVDVEGLVRCFGSVRKRYYATRPSRLDDKSAVSSYAGPHAVVVHITELDDLVSPFSKHGYYLLEDVKPSEARKRTLAGAADKNAARPETSERSHT